MAHNGKQVRGRFFARQPPERGITVFSPFHTLRYRVRPEVPGIFEVNSRNFDSFPLEGYDVVILIGRDGEGSEKVKACLDSEGFQEVGGNGFTGIFAKSES